MEIVTVEVPIAAGTKVYRTSKECTIEVGTVEEVIITLKEYMKSASPCDVTSVPSKAKDNINTSIYVNWGGTIYGNLQYHPVDDINTKFFLSKEELINYISNKV